MTKSELILALSGRQTHLAQPDVELAVKSVIDQMADSLATGERIEVRGFGSFSLHFRPPRMGKELRERVNASARPAVKASSKSGAR